MSSYTTKPKSRFQEFMTNAPVRVAVVIICFLWTIPTLGLLVSSFREKK